MTGPVRLNEALSVRPVARYPITATGLLEKLNVLIHIWYHIQTSLYITYDDGSD